MIDANLKGLRESVLRRADWPNATSTGQSRVDAFLNEAIAQIALEAPFLFNETMIRFASEPDLVPNDDTDTFVVDTNDDSITVSGANPYVLLKSLDITQEQTVLPYDRSLDGRFIELTGSDGVVHRNQIRSAWLETDYNGGSLDYYALSLVRPLDYGNTTGYARDALSWRIFTPVYYLPDDVIQIESLRVVGATMPAKIEFIGQDDAENNAILDVTGDQAGAIPMWAYRRGHFQLQGSNTAPITALANTWVGPEPPGVFEYCYTVAWGKLDVDYENGGLPNVAYTHLDYQENDGDSTVQTSFWGPNRTREPRWESAPSPISAQVTVPPPGGGGLASNSGVLLTFPNLEYELGFYLKGVSDASAFNRSSSVHSGCHIRIYRRRISADFTNYATFGTAVGTRTTGLSKLDITGDFYLLAEFRIDTVNQAQFSDTGFFIPDKNRPLRNTHGYMGMGLYPVPDARYELEARVIRRPRRLNSDYDVPTIHAEASKLIVDYAVAMLYENLKDPVSAMAAMQSYQRNLQVLVKRYSELRPPSQPVRRMPARTNRNARFRPWWRTS